jgi:hypothetical protein
LPSCSSHMSVDPATHALPYGQGLGLVSAGDRTIRSDDRCRLANGAATEPCRAISRLMVCKESCTMWPFRKQRRRCLVARDGAWQRRRGLVARDRAWQRRRGFVALGDGLPYLFNSSRRRTVLLSFVLVVQKRGGATGACNWRQPSKFHVEACKLLQVKMDGSTMGMKRLQQIRRDRQELT